MKPRWYDHLTTTQLPAIAPYPKSSKSLCFHAQNHAQRALVNDASRTKDELLEKVDNTNTTGANAQWAPKTTVLTVGFEVDLTAAAVAAMAVRGKRSRVVALVRRACALAGREH